MENKNEARPLDSVPSKILRENPKYISSEFVFRGSLDKGQEKKKVRV